MKLDLKIGDILRTTVGVYGRRLSPNTHVKILSGSLLIVTDLQKTSKSYISSVAKRGPNGEILPSSVILDIPGTLSFNWVEKVSLLDLMAESI